MFLVKVERWFTFNGECSSESLTVSRFTDQESAREALDNRVEERMYLTGTEIPTGAVITRTKDQALIEWHRDGVGPLFSSEILTITETNPITDHLKGI